jgi:hypothetical protein
MQWPHKFTEAIPSFYILGVGFTVVKFNEEQGCLDTFIEILFFSFQLVAQIYKLNAEKAGENSTKMKLTESRSDISMISYIYLLKCFLYALIIDIQSGKSTSLLELSRRP